MKKGFKKFAKGMFGIFIIKLVIFSIVLTYQSCDDGEVLDSEKNIARNAFMESLRKTQNNLSTVQLSSGKEVLNNGGLITRSLEEGLVEVRTVKTDPDEEVEPTETFDKLTELINSGVLQIDEEEECIDLGEQTLCHVVYVDEDEVDGAIQPSVIAAKNYLKTLGLSDSDINQIVLEEAGTEEDLVPLVMAMVELEKIDDSGVTDINLMSSLFASPVYAQSWSDIGQCALAAIGADLIWSLGSDGGKWTKKAIRKAFGAVAKRFLGPIGVAIAVVTFGICVANAAITDA